MNIITESRAGGEQGWKRQRRETLLELANLSDIDSKRFMRQIGSTYYYHRSFRSGPIAYRDDLRKIWSGNREETSVVLERWLQEAREEPPWHLTSRTYQRRLSWGVAPNYAVFPLALALGVSELSSKMAVCENPECPNRYFLKARKTQRFCDRPACTAYGQREHKKQWWRAHGEQWKQQRDKSRAVTPKKRKSGGR